MTDKTLQTHLIGCRLRLTAVTNGADALLRVIDTLIDDIPGDINGLIREYEIDIDQIRSDLRTAIRVARGGSERLSPRLFEDVADAAAVRTARDMGLL